MNKIKTFPLTAFLKMVHKQKIDLHKPLSEELIIKEIDKPLYDYGMIYKFDINYNYFSNEDPGKAKIMLIKSVSIFSFMVLSLFRFCIYINFTDSDITNPNKILQM